MFEYRSLCTQSDPSAILTEFGKDGWRVVFVNVVGANFTEPDGEGNATKAEVCTLYTLERPVGSNTSAVNAKSVDEAVKAVGRDFIGKNTGLRGLGRD